MAGLAIVWTEPALSDLDRIADYIALDKPYAASHLVQRVFDAVEQLADFPESGSRPKELKGTIYRHLVMPPLRIFYRIQETQVFIIYVMRGEKLLHLDDLTGRDWSA
jgi:toxin ParE1/3/4